MLFKISFKVEACFDQLKKRRNEHSFARQNMYLTKKQQQNHSELTPNQQLENKCSLSKRRQISLQCLKKELPCLHHDF